MIEEIKTPAEAGESSKGILPIINTDVKHLQELREAALEYVGKGLGVVPMGCNKQAQDYKLPLIRWKEEGPLRTETEVNRAFDQLGGKVFGIATIIAGYTLVDFDTKDTPKLFLGLEPTASFETGKGSHMWYAADSAVTKNGPVDLSEFEKRDGKKYQLEVYTNKRLDIVPPSLHHSGVRYEWSIPFEDISKLSKLPESIAKLCEKKRESTKTAGVVTEGGRHSALVKVATKAAHNAKGSREKIEMVVKKWNLINCVPPLSEEEVDRVIDWVVTNFEAGELDKQSKGKKLQEFLDEDEGMTLFHDQEGAGYARICFKNKAVNVAIQSTEFKDYARHLFYKRTGESISNLQLEEVVGLCKAKAVYECEKYHLYHRVAQMGGAFYYDLNNEAGEIVKIDEAGWTIQPNSEMPFLFKMGCGREQISPVRGGELKDLLPLLNIEDSEEEMLFLCTLPVRLIRDVGQAIAYVYGPAGSGKTTLLKIVKDLLDPSSGGISMPIKKVEDAVPLLSQSWVFANDNISRINDELSDFLCVVATGAENSRRTLYTNSDITVFTLKNPAYLTGVNVEAYRSDLMSRLLLFKTQAVATGGRRSEGELEQAFQNLKPLFLGALFETLSLAIEAKKILPQKTEFRMADFALWGAACAEVLGYGAERFEKALQGAMRHGAYDAVYSLSTGRALLEMLNKEDSFTGTATQLLRKLKDTDGGFEWSEEVAKNPATLSKKLRELENSLATLGILVDFGKRTGAERTLVIKKRDVMTAVTGN